MLRIGNIELDMPVFQAPLSGYTDLAMRTIAREHGAPLTFTGVMLAKNVLNAKAMRKGIFNPGKDEYPIGAQILGGDPDIMGKAAGVFAGIGYDLIDINFACPAPKVLRRGRGGALLKDPDRAIEIFKRVRDAANCPVTIKLRIGFGTDDGTQDNFWRICEATCTGGVDALVIHGRTVKGYYRGKANWEIVRQVKKHWPTAVVIGSGDIFDAETAVERLGLDEIDGIIVARGAIGNPWIFREIRSLLDGKGKGEMPSITEQGKVILRHFEMVSELHNELKGVRYFRKFAAGYCKRHPERKKAMLAIMASKSRNDILAAIKQWYDV